MAVSWKKINKDKQEEKVRAGVRIVVNMMLVVVAYTLRNKFNFGYHRIWRAINYINTTFDDIYYGRINIKDLESVLQEECQVKIPN